MLGSAVLFERIAMIALLAPEVAVVDPAPFVAVTTKRVVEPIMLVSRPSVVPVAPEISLHEPPEELHSSHWYLKLDSLPDQEPFAPVSLGPSSSRPATLVNAVFAGSSALIT